MVARKRNLSGRGLLLTERVKVEIVGLEDQKGQVCSLSYNTPHYEGPKPIAQYIQALSKTLIFL
jgi:hypothetical protein